MNFRTIVYSLLTGLFLFACNGGSSEDVTEKPETIVEEPLKQEETEQDTTLQPVQELSIRAVGTEEESMAFDQDTLEVKANALVKLELINEGSDPKMIYNIVFTQPGQYKRAAQEGSKAGATANYLPDSSIIIAASPLALPGQTVKLEFVAPESTGTYDFVSTYPGDYERMRGTLIVK
ncbi:plastocyanin/azurin family copper-binding protein [Pontibacter roseus]|uniref:plastocyanin/azurin family copper-binding protein n=1 Tax=Pontibacter roseus TaxID=336989 RepID=UPI0003653819|nr:plastocyanin/azurin family copper-binding protein [Pontibacter roseus]